MCCRRAICRCIVVVVCEIRYGFGTFVYVRRWCSALICRVPIVVLLRAYVLCFWLPLWLSIYISRALSLLPHGVACMRGFSWALLGAEACEAPACSCGRHAAAARLGSIIVSFTS